MLSLSPDAARQYRDDGYYAPVRVLSTEEARALRRHLETHEARAGRLGGALRQKSHLLFAWLNDLVRHHRILDAVEDLIGPDILCWGSSFFIKQPRDTATLVRGVDRYGHFEPERRPDADCSPAALAYHAAVTGAHAQILMRGTGKEMRA